MPKASAFWEYRGTFQNDSSSSLSFRSRLSAGWLTLMRHEDRATHPGQTAHPQFHAGLIAQLHAALDMSLPRLGLALVCEDTPTSEESHVCRLHTLGRNRRQNMIP